MINAGSEPKLKVLVFGASLRADSLNQKLAALAGRIATQSGATVDHASMRDFDVPPYDGDAEKADGIPKGAEALRRCLVESDAFVVSSPEYNGSMSGVFKNLTKSGVAPGPADRPDLRGVCSHDATQRAGVAHPWTHRSRRRTARGHRSALRARGWGRQVGC